MSQTDKIRDDLRGLDALHGVCYAIGLHIRFNHPTLLYQTYPEAWIAYYAKNGLVFADPAVRWGMTHTGTCDWADLAADDTEGVLRTAAGFGLAHGVVISLGDETTRSLGFFAHSSRPLTAEERDLTGSVMSQLHAHTKGFPDLTPLELAPYLALSETLRAEKPRPSA